MYKWKYNIDDLFTPYKNSKNRKRYIKNAMNRFDLNKYDAARTLDALTTVIKQSLYKDLGESYKFVLDIGEYKQKREWNLEKMAKSIDFFKKCDIIFSVKNT